jgi:predicted amidohydrolase YtcJ
VRPDTAFIGGRVWTGDPGRPWVHSIATSGGLIVALDDADVCARAREVVQLRGRIVMPGFNDAHHHLALRGRRIASLDVSHDASPPGRSSMLPAAVAPCSCPTCPSICPS